MFARPGLVQEWQMRLTAWRQQLDDGGGPHPWLARIYVRVLSFMVARYGDQEAAVEEIAPAEPPTDLSRPQREPPATFIPADLPQAGKAPRSGEQIRSALQAVRRQDSRVAEQGPLARGLTSDDEIAVAAFYSEVEIRRLQQMLADAGIASHVRRSRKLFQACISFRDLDRAKPIVSEHAVDARDSIRARRSNARLCREIGAWLGFLIVGVAAMLLVALTTPASLDWRHLLAVMFLGGIYGAIFGASIGTVVGMILDD